MMLQESFYKTKNFVHRTFRNLKSSLSGDYQKLPKTPRVNPLFNPKMQELDNFYRDFSKHWDSGCNKVLKKKKKGFSAKEKRKGDEKSSCNGSYKNDDRKEEKKTDESSTVCQTCMEGKRVEPSSQIVNDLAQKMKEMELLDMNDLDHVMDMEEVMHYYSRLTCPLYLDIVDKFFMDVYRELYPS
ncbi:uncharacterized protein LOC111402994 [Olea europaea var. sylvestris]|uniref:uncharacterized protein LOC111402994 n=1 Tax=Olea europaea var. sylvestris TaxID=158386 RepID=UPI000C1D0E38|nr:uncharacterized protein LOC111402994 [Olea europaea var. sylvestris]